MGFPYIGFTYSIYIGKDSSIILGTWNFWWTGIPSLGAGFFNIFYFHLYLGKEDFQFDGRIIFSGELVQPLTSRVFWCWKGHLFVAWHWGRLMERLIEHLEPPMLARIAQEILPKARNGSLMDKTVPRVVFFWRHVVGWIKVCPDCVSHWYLVFVLVSDHCMILPLMAAILHHLRCIKPCE